MADQPVFDTLRLTQRELRDLLLSLQPDKSYDETASRRRARRWGLGGMKILITLLDDAGNQQHYVSAARDLSSAGLSFLHGGYLHTGTACLVTIPTTDDSQSHTVRATVRRCRHLQKHLHDIGVEFAYAVDPRWFLDFGDEHVFTLESVNLSDLRGTLLIVEDNRMFQKLLATYFKDSQLELEFAEDGAAALERIAQIPDMVFTDFNLPDTDAVGIITRARENGYSGPIVVLTADTTPGLRKRVLDAGANEMLVKPCAPAVLHQAAAEYLLATTVDGASQSQIISTCTPDEMDRELILDYIDDLAERAREIDRLVESDDLNGARESICQIKASATGYGFAPITAAAGDAIRSLDASMSLAESRTLIQRLIMACRRAAPPLIEESDSRAA